VEFNQHQSSLLPLRSKARLADGGRPKVSVSKSPVSSPWLPPETDKEKTVKLQLRHSWPKCPPGLFSGSGKVVCTASVRAVLCASFAFLDRADLEKIMMITIQKRKSPEWASAPNRGSPDSLREGTSCNPLYLPDFGLQGNWIFPAEVRS
jgi:hypothetical protein